MNELALFAGAGGGLLGSKLLGWRTVCYVELDPYCVEVLKARIRDGYLDDAPIWDDARTFDGRLWDGCVDIVTAGFPCQPFSVAGKRLGSADERNLWPDTIRIIREVGPSYVLLENVPGLLAWDGGSYFGKILGELAESGYDARWRVLSAAEVGAPHRRDRLWIVANRQGDGCAREHVPIRPGRPQQAATHAARDGAILSDSNGEPLEWPTESWLQYGYWSVEPRVRRVAHGIPNRVDRITALGNAQVPGVVAVVWRSLGPAGDQS